MDKETQSVLEQSMAQTRQAVVWSAILLGWFVIAALLVIEFRFGIPYPDPPFPSGGAAAAAAAFWFLFVLSINGLADLVRALMGGLNQGFLNTLAHHWVLPFLGVLTGLLFARFLWSS